MDNNTKYELWEFLLAEIPSAKKYNEHEIIARCPFCGDSIKNMSSRHFGIKIDFKSNDPIVFKCFRCLISGFFTPATLRMFEVNDLQMNSSLLKYNNEAISNLGDKSMYVSYKKIDLDIPLPEDTTDNKLKKKYIEDRLGIETSFEELHSLKTIFSLGDTLIENKIEKLTCKPDRAIRLNQDYVGFLTIKNEFINFRNVIENNNLRYDVYSLFNNMDNTRKFYCVPNTIDIMTTETIYINLAEGVFDTLGLYYNVFNQETKNMIHAAVCGCGFTNVIEFFLSQGIIGDNVVINIFSDDDKDINFYNRLRIKERFKPWVGEINLYYNTLSKDYGVSKDKLNIIKKRI